MTVPELRRFGQSHWSRLTISKAKWCSFILQKVNSLIKASSWLIIPLLCKKLSLACSQVRLLQ